jgi:AraC-like DNA-binding protein
LTGFPKDMIESPNPFPGRALTSSDVLSNVLRTIRLSGSLQFCFMPTGAWRTASESSLKSLTGGSSATATMPFHILVEGTCWMRMQGREYVLEAGDVVVFPLGTSHDLGAGSDGIIVNPVADLPPKPWQEIPLVRYGDAPERVRILCGYLQCDAMSFRPLQAALPPLLHVRTGTDGEGWLGATIRQIVAEVERPRTGGLSMLERLTEIAFIELLRHEISKARPDAVGWMAALADPRLERCMAAIHEDPTRNWSLQELATLSGLSRSTLSERFEAVLQTAPMRYVRDWRLHLASVALSTTAKTIAAVAHAIGYESEAAFNRAFPRAYGIPPATWRQNARRGLSAGEGALS